MIKRLITWLYERFCLEEDHKYTEEEKDRLESRFIKSKEIYYLFYDAGFFGREKPQYPMINGKEMQKYTKSYLDDVYLSAKENATALAAIKKERAAK